MIESPLPTTGLAPPPLAGIRVLEVGDTIAAAYAGRLLADLGADVVKVEDGHGDPTRALGPFVGGDADPEHSAGYAYLNAAKRSVHTDVRAPEGQELLGRLVAGADVVIQATRADRPWLDGATLAAARAADPALIVTEIRPFGATGPRAGTPAPGPAPRPPGRHPGPRAGTPAPGPAPRAPTWWCWRPAGCCRSTPPAPPTLWPPPCATGGSSPRSTPPRGPWWPRWAPCTPAGATDRARSSTCRPRRRRRPSWPPPCPTSATSAWSRPTTAPGGCARGPPTPAPMGPCWCSAPRTSSGGGGWPSSASPSGASWRCSTPRRPGSSTPRPSRPSWPGPWARCRPRPS